MAEINLGGASVEITATTDKLKASLNGAKAETEKAAQKMEKDFKEAADGASLSWKEFVGQRMGSYMKELGSHGAAIQKIAAEWKEYKASGEGALVKVKQDLDKVNASLRETPNVLRQTTQGTNQMNMALGQLGFLVGDADMFFVNFRMGMMSIANNVPMVVQGLMYAKKASEETGQSFKSALVGSLMGPGGVMLAINALMFALNVLPRLFEDSDKAIEEHKEKLKSLREEYSKLTREQITNYLSELDKQLAELEKKYPAQKTQTITKVVGGNAVSESVTVGVKGGDRFSGEWGTVQDIQNRQAALKETLRDLGVIENIGNRLTLNQEKLNKLNRDPASPFYFQNIVKTAKSYEEAKAVVEQWIKADEERSKKKGGSGGGKSEIERLLEEEQGYKKELTDIDAALKQTNISEFTRNELLAKRADLLEKIHKWDRVDAARKAGLGDVQGLTGLDNLGRKNKDGIYVPDTTMMPIDSETVRKQKEQSDNGFKSSMKEFEQYQSSVEDFANTISSAFVNGISAGENLGEVFKNLAIQLAGMVAQSLIFKAIMSAFDFGTGGAGLAIGAIASGVSGSLAPSTGSMGGTFSNPQSSGLNLNSLASEIRGVKSAVQAMNVNIMSQKPIVVKNYLDGKPIAYNNAKYQKQFAQGNIQV